MPAIFEATCGQCGHHHMWSDVWIVFLNDAGEEEILPHPGEATDLEQRGYTFGQLQRDGRLCRRHPALCEDCGQGVELDADDARIVSPGGGGFRAGCTMVFLVPAMLGLWILFSTWSIGLRLLLATPLVLFSLRLLVNTRSMLFGASLLGPASSIEGAECQRCGGRLRRPYDLVEKTIRCPSCDALAYRVALVGRS